MTSTRKASSRNFLVIISFITAILLVILLETERNKKHLSPLNNNNLIGSDAVKTRL